MLPSINPISPSTAFEEGIQAMEMYKNMSSLGGLNETTPFLQEDSLSFDDFAPTLAQCFFIVLTSYFFGKVKLLSASDVRGVTAFATYFGMPGIISVTLADADIRNVEWQLLVGTILGKAIIFGIVAGATMLMTQPADLSTAAMLAMFCVQCNDLPVGNPLMSALYRDRRPHMLKYLFLIPALTIIFFGPVTHIMIEAAKEKPLHNDIHRSSSEISLFSKISRKIRLILPHRMTGEIILNLMKNPIIIATFFGIMLNYSFKADLPGVLHQPINVVATMIPGLALCVLGFSMLGKERHILSSGIILASVLIAVKMVLTPVVLFYSVKMLAGDQHKEMLDFSLLYGIVSPAAIVFQYGEKYRFPIVAMSAALIVSSFTCFPLSYIIAKLSLDGYQDLNYYIPTLGYILLFVAVITLICCVAVWISLIWNRPRKLPFIFILFLVLSQVWMALGVVVWQACDDCYTWTVQGQIVLACGGEMMIGIWTAALSLLLVFQQNNQCSSTFKIILIPMCSFGISGGTIFVLCTVVFHHNLQDALIYGQPKSGYEYFQLELVTGVLTMCLIIGGVCFVLYRKRWKPTKICKEPSAIPLETQASDKGYAFTINLKTPESHDNPKRASNFSTASTIVAFNDQDEKTLYYDEVIKTSQSEKILVFGADWTFRLTSLLILLWITIAVKVLTNFLKIAECRVTAMTVPLEYLQAILFTGQGLWTFLTCGVDIRTAFISLKKRWRQMRYGKENIQKDFSPTENEEVKRVCQQFRAFFYDRSFKDLAKERIWKKNHYQNSFWGHQMVNWLIKAGLTQDELEAEEYGQRLLCGGIISHVRSAHNFLDAPYLYYFVKTNVPKSS